MSPLLATSMSPASDWISRGGLVGLPVVLAALGSMNIWLSVYAIFLGSRRGQGVYFWMFLTLIFGPFAIIALLRQPVLRACPECEGDVPRDEPICPFCGHVFVKADDRLEAPPLYPEELD